MIFPAHPGPASIEQFGIDTGKLHVAEPLPYIEFLSLQNHATVVITDSGCIRQEHNTSVPCLTLRGRTERPVTVSTATNILVGQDPALLNSELTRFWKEEKQAIVGRPRCGKLRSNTERPVTVSMGTNVLVGQGTRGSLPLAWREYSKEKKEATHTAVVGRSRKRNGFRKFCRVAGFMGRPVRRGSLFR